MKTFRTYLAEAISDTVYFTASVRDLKDIIVTNRYILTTIVGDGGTEVGTRSGRNQYGDYWYYMSVARSPSSSYFTNPGYFELDGRKLGYRYKGKAVDYWGDPKDGNWMKKDEKEDRIFTNEPVIKDFRQYIRAVHLLWDERFDLPDVDTDEYKSEYRALIYACKRAGVKIYVYDSPTDHLRRNTRNAMENPDERLRGISLKVRPIDSYFSQYDRDDIAVWTDLVNAKTKDDITLEKGHRWVHSLTYSHDVKGFVDSLNILFRNNRKRGASEALMDLLRRTRTRTPQEFVEYLKKKFQPSE